MLIRIVKLHFQEDRIDEFKALFVNQKNKIRAVKGCNRLELLQDQQTPAIFFTYSWWDGPNYLEDYRQSDLFKGIWTETKVLFDKKAEAWSVNQLVKLD